MEQHLPAIELKVRSSVVAAHKKMNSDRKNNSDTLETSEAVFDALSELAKNLDVDYEQDAYFKDYLK